MNTATLTVAQDGPVEQAQHLLRTALVAFQALIDDPAVQEIMVNSPTDIWVERAGVMSKTDIRLGAHAIESTKRLLATVNRKRESSAHMPPIMDSMFDGMRLVLIDQSIAKRGTCICIRKQDGQPWSLDEYLSRGMFAVDQASIAARMAKDESFDRKSVGAGGEAIQHLVRWALATKRSVLVSGDTSSGKTKFLRALAMAIPVTDRVVTIEDTAELKLRHPNMVELEANHEKSVTVRNCCAAAMRLRPDRMVLGEVRGEEAYDLLAAMNTGHPVLSTIHANSAVDALARLETLVLLAGTQMPSTVIRRQIAASTNLVFHFSKFSGVRELREIIEVTGIDGDSFQTQVLFKKEGLSHEI